MENQELFDIKKSVLAVLRRKRIVSVCLVLGILAGGIYSGINTFSEYKASEQHRADYLENLESQKSIIQNNITQIDQYSSESILLNIDVNSAPFTTVKVYLYNDVWDPNAVTNDFSMLNNVISSYASKPITDEMVNSINTTLGTNYTAHALSELIYVSRDTQSAVIEVTAFAESTQHSQVILNSFISYAYSYINATVSLHQIAFFGERSNISYSPLLQSIQKDYLETLTKQRERFRDINNKINEVLKYSEPNHAMEEIVKTGLIFGAGGLIIGILISLILDSIDTKIYTKKDLIEYNIPLIGDIQPGRNNFRKTYRNKLEERVPLPLDNQVEILSQYITNRYINTDNTQNPVNILLTGSIDIAYIDSLRNRISEAIELEIDSLNTKNEDIEQDQIESKEDFRGNITEELSINDSDITDQGSNVEESSEEINSEVIYNQPENNIDEIELFSVISAKNIIENKKTVALVEQSDVIILVESFGISDKYIVQEELNIIKSMDGNVIGFVNVSP